MDEFLIPRTSGHVGLRLCAPERDSQGQLNYFSVEITDPSIRAVTRVYIIDPGRLVDLFDEMALSWRGWADSKDWESIEGQLKLSFKADKMGHVFANIRVAEAPDSWRLEATAKFETGQLEKLSRSLSIFLLGSGSAA